MASQPREAKQRYQEMGYDFIAMTDPRTRTCDTHWWENMLVLSGIELDFMLVNQAVAPDWRGHGREYRGGRQAAPLAERY